MGTQVKFIGLCRLNGSGFNSWPVSIHVGLGLPPGTAVRDYIVDYNKQKIRLSIDVAAKFLYFVGPTLMESKR